MLINEQNGICNMKNLFKIVENWINPFTTKPVDFENKNSIGILIQFVSRLKGIFFLYATTGIVKSLVDVAIISWFGILIDSASKNYSSFSQSILFYSLITFGLIACRPLVSFIFTLIASQGVQGKLSALVRWQVYRRISQQSYSFFLKEQSGILAAKAWQLGQAVTEICIQVFGVLWVNIVFSVSAVVYLATLSTWFIALIFVWTLVFILLSVIFVPLTKNRSRYSAKQSNLGNGALVDEFSNIQTLINYDASAHRYDYVKNKLSLFISAAHSFLRAVTIGQTSLTTVNSLALGGMFGLTIYLWGNAHISIGEGAAALTFALRLDSFFAAFMSQMTTLFQWYGVFQASIDVARQKICLNSPENPTPMREGPLGIEFDGVSFSYDHDKVALSNINLNIAPGEKVAIVGVSGSGKSTIIKLILRLYDADKGTVRVGGIDVRELSLPELRSRIGYVSQDVSLLHRSIRDNVAVANDNLNDEKIRQACELASAWEFITNATDAEGRTGLDAMVGERGMQLSGGQRQRISLARVFLTRPDIVIFDEATSALDAITDKEIISSIRNGFSGKTIIMIAHRLTSITWADKIVSVGDGIIVEAGTHEDLLAKNESLYKQLWNDHQSNKRDEN